jgi:Fe-S cluster biogenesis protein NfuA/nitrite reductase/ring-hydroxylating ferredoxin subunit
MSAAPTPTRHGDLTEADFAAVGKRLDELVQEFEAMPFPQVREAVFELLQTVDALHRAGLGRLLATLEANDGGALIARAAEDPIVRVLFTLYDLLPSDPHAQVENALSTVRPYIQSHGGEIDVLDVVAGVVHVRLAGSCDGCAGSTTTLKRGVETALREGFPDFAGMVVHDPAPRPARSMSNVIPLIPVGLGAAPAAPPRPPVFTEVAHAEDVPPGTIKEIASDGGRVLLANVGGEIYAVGAACPGSMAPLGLGVFTPPILVCPWHNEAFDVRTGKRVDGQTQPVLDVLPIAVRDGVILVAVGATPSGNPS